MLNLYPLSFFYVCKFGLNSRLDSRNACVWVEKKELSSVKKVKCKFFRNRKCCMTIITRLKEVWANLFCLISQINQLSRRRDEKHFHSPFFLMLSSLRHKLDDNWLSYYMLKELIFIHSIIFIILSTLKIA